MESLKKLEEVQQLLELLHSHGITSSHANNNPHTHPFFSHFLLFLIQPWGCLDLAEKCVLISEFLQLVSNEFLEDVVEWNSARGGVCGAAGRYGLEKDSMLACKCKIKSDPTKPEVQNMDMVGFNALQDANSTLEDFCRSYFMFHEMDANEAESIFRYLPVLSFTESFIYQLDRLNERILSPEREKDEDVNKWVGTFVSDPFKPLSDVLERQGLLTERIKEELRNGEEYWALERKLCSERRKDKILLEDVMRAMHMKSFDYRVLNLLLYLLRGEQVNETHMRFLTVSEFLVEISDDLFDYEDDVLGNNFNILRMFVRIYGVSLAPSMLAKCITEAEERYEELLKVIDDPDLSLKYQRRCEEATTRDCGGVSGPALGKWTIPHVICDEDAHRRRVFGNDCL